MFKRPSEVKARIAEKITEIICQEGKVPADRVQVIFSDIDSDGLAHGGKMEKPTPPNVVMT